MTFLSTIKQTNDVGENILHLLWLLPAIMNLISYSSKREDDVGEKILCILILKIMRIIWWIVVFIPLERYIHTSYCTPGQAQWLLCLTSWPPLLPTRHLYNMVQYHFNWGPCFNNLKIAYIYLYNIGNEFIYVYWVKILQNKSIFDKLVLPLKLLL